MNIEVTMPQLGETVAEGTVTRWLKQVGEQVAEHEPLLEIATDKVDTEVPSPGAGTLLEIVVGEDATVSVGTLLGVISAIPVAASAPPAPPVVQPTAAPAPPPDASIGHASAGPVSTARSGPRHRHSPRVRRLAGAHGIALELLHGTGPRGRVTPRDVLAAAESEVASGGGVAVRTPPAEAIPQRHAVAPRDAAPPAGMPSAVQDRATAVVEVDVTDLVALIRARFGDIERRLGVPLGPVAFVARAVVEALRVVPALDASADGRTQPLGVMVEHADRAAHLVRIDDAGDLALLGLGRRLADTGGSAATRTTTVDDAFVIVDTGGRGTLFETPVPVFGRYGALGLGAIVERPAV
ncbi:MAG: biotin/lipoyl-containing protein, partial [Jatrophihabitans sp.]|uniref:biotin/lipoyl-containing protein n=1 Tax=Jatrophihabitans sp. TaxID=1932789 RepID=UPI003F822395